MRSTLVVLALAGLGASALLLHSRNSGAQTSAAAKNAAMVQAGQQTFTKNCLLCHTYVQGQVTFGPNLYGELKPPHPKKTPAEVRELLKSGKGKMPPFKDKLTDQDVTNLLAYLHTL